MRIYIIRLHLSYIFSESDLTTIDQNLQLRLLIHESKREFSVWEYFIIWSILSHTSGQIQKNLFISQE